MTVVTEPSGDPLVQPRSPRVGRHSDHENWIGSSLARAMRRAQLIGIVLVQMILLVAALASAIAVPQTTAVLVAAAVAAAALVVLVRREHAWILIFTYYLALGFYYVVAVNPNDPLLGALIPLTAWTVILPIMLWPGIWPIIVSGLLTVIYAGLIVLAHPGWDRSVVIASLVTNAILVVNAAVFIAFLRRIAGSLDRQKKAVVDEEARAVRQQASKDATAEYVRVLHDTIVNTFGALAREQAQGTGPEDAQERCRRDLERIRTFQCNTATGRRPRLSLTELDHVGLPVRWAGLSGDDLRRFQALLPVAVLDGFYGCASEAVLNATKHSGSDHVVVAIQYVNDELRVAISDDGRGFDRTNVDERGITGSIVARGEANGISVALESAIGEGTTVRLTYPLSTPSDAADPSTTTQPLGRFTRKMSIAWALHAIAIGVSLEAFSPRSDSLLAYLLLAALLFFAGASWITSRNEGSSPRWLIALMFTAIPAVSWCALASVGYGNDAPYLFQAVALTVLPVLIHASSRTFTPFFFAVGIQGASMFVIGTSVIGADPSRYLEVVLLEAPTAALLTMWFVLLRKFRSIEVEMAESQVSLERAMRDAAAHESAAEVQMQWSASGLRGSIELLQDIADGVISPNDPETRRRCGEEEAFLRQVGVLSQSSTLMSQWFALALAEARARQIQLELQAERTQIDDADDADALGHLMLDCIAASPEKNTLNVTLVQSPRGTRMLIVGSLDSELAALTRDDQDRLRITIETLPNQVLVEAHLQAAGERTR